MKRFLVAPLVVALAAVTLAVLPGSPAAAALIDARVGALTFRPDAPGTGARRLASASVRQDLYLDRVSGTFVLDAEPVAGTTSYLRVTFGHLDAGRSCQGDLELRTDTTSPSNGFTRSGRTLRLVATERRFGYQDWDCAFAVLDLDTNGDASDGSVRSVLIGELTDVPARPVLAVTGVQLLDARALRLVRGVWTTIEVTVANRGRADAARVVLRGSGRGVQVRPTPVGVVRDDDDTTVQVRVRLTGKRATTLRLTASGGGATASRSVRVARAKAPARPRPGTYRSADGDTTFSVSGGKIRGFRVRTTTRCGGYPDIPTTTYNTYSFRTVGVPRNGIVVAKEKGRLYTARLQLRIAGGKVTQGRFSYAGPAACFAVERFTASRRR
ncbi:hypothetical protein ABFT23_06340 [Nocardioides sp. C4-1]|uniref:hypothetical protein n=1 Tax=Nocardioides sp. C4-1 TaxID=3151851 RepID=UPI0032647726